MKNAKELAYNLYSYIKFSQQISPLNEHEICRDLAEGLQKVQQEAFCTGAETMKQKVVAELQCLIRDATASADAAYVYVKALPLPEMPTATEWK